MKPLNVVEIPTTPTHVKFEDVPVRGVFKITWHEGTHTYLKATLTRAVNLTLGGLEVIITGSPVVPCEATITVKEAN